MNSNAKCTMFRLRKDLMRGLVVEALSGSIIKFIDDKSNIFFRDIIQVNFFGSMLFGATESGKISCIFKSVDIITAYVPQAGTLKNDGPIPANMHIILKEKF